MLPQFRLLSRILFTAGSFTLASVCLAGESTPVPPTTPQQTVSGDVSRIRNEAMKVEIAWLADLSTYALRVEARPMEDSIEVRGVVPDATARKRVLEIARQNCYAPVIDRLTVGSTVQIVQGSTVSTLQNRVRETLVRRLGAPAGKVEILVREDGRITLRGQVDSIDEKLLASKCLRDVPGVQSVVNQIGVLGKPSPTQTISLTSAIEEKAEPKPVTASKSTTPVSEPTIKVNHTELSANSPYTSTVTTTTTTTPAVSGSIPVVPSGLPQIRYMNVHMEQSEKMQPGRPVMYVVPVSPGEAKPVSPTVVTAPPTKKESSSQGLGLFQRLTRSRKKSTTKPQSTTVEHHVVYQGQGTQEVVPSVSPVSVPATTSQPRIVNHSATIQTYSSPAPVAPSTQVQPTPTVVTAPPSSSTTYQSSTYQSSNQPFRSRPLGDVVRRQQMGTLVTYSSLPKPMDTPQTAPPPAPPQPSSTLVKNTPEISAPTSVKVPDPAPSSGQMYALPTMSGSTPKAVPAEAEHEVLTPPKTRQPITTPQPEKKVSQTEQKPIAEKVTEPEVQPALVKVPRTVESPVTEKVPEPQVKPVSAKVPLPERKPVQAPRVEAPLKVVHEAKDPELQPTKRPPTELARIVRSACGKLAHQVRVEITSQRMMIVHIHADAKVEQQLLGKLMELSDLAATNVKLHVHLSE